MNTLNSLTRFHAIFLFCNCARLRKGKNQTLWSSNCFSLIRVGNLPFRSSLFCSKSLILKSDCERLALLALYKRATMSKSLSLLFTKEQPWVNRSSRSLQKSYCERIALNFLKKGQCQWFAQDSWESLSKNKQLPGKNLFFVCLDSFWQFSPFLWANRRSLQESDSLFFTSKSLFLSQKMSNLLEKLISEFPTLNCKYNKKCQLFLSLSFRTVWVPIHCRSIKIIYDVATESFLSKILLFAPLGILLSTLVNLSKTWSLSWNPGERWVEINSYAST